MPFLARKWWLLLVRGILAVLFGILAMAWPGITLLALAILFGAYALADGVASIASAIIRRRRGERTWWEMVVVGLLGIGAGIITFLWPGLTAVGLVLLMGAWALLHGVFEIVAAIRLRKVLRHEWLLALAGIISIAFGLLVFLQPGAGALALVAIIAAYSILFGVLAIAVSFRLRRLRESYAAI